MAAQRASSSRCMSLSYSASRACSVTCREEGRRGKEGGRRGGREGERVCREGEEGGKWECGEGGGGKEKVGSRGEREGLKEHIH